MWYIAEEIRRWSEVQCRGLEEHADWLAANLNRAFNKGKDKCARQLEEANEEIRRLKLSLREHMDSY